MDARKTRVFYDDLIYFFIFKTGFDIFDILTNSVNFILLHFVGLMAQISVLGLKPYLVIWMRSRRSKRSNRLRMKAYI